MTGSAGHLQAEIAALPQPLRESAGLYLEPVADIDLPDQGFAGTLARLAACSDFAGRSLPANFATTKRARFSHRAAIPAATLIRTWLISRHRSRRMQPVLRSFKRSPLNSELRPCMPIWGMSKTMPKKA